MKISEFVSNYRMNNPKGHFFDKEALHFFGERYSDMSYNGVRVITDACGRVRKCHEIRSVQRDSVLGTRWKLHYFDENTFDQVIPDFDMVDSGRWSKM